MDRKFCHSSASGYVAFYGCLFPCIIRICLGVTAAAIGSIVRSSPARSSVVVLSLVMADHRSFHLGLDFEKFAFAIPRILESEGSHAIGEWYATSRSERIAGGCVLR